MPSKNNDDKEVHQISSIFIIFHFTVFLIYTAVQTKTWLTVAIAAFFAIISFIASNWLSAIIKRMDRFDFLEKLPVEVRSFLRRNPEIRSSLALWVLMLLVSLIFFDLSIFLFTKSPTFTVLKTFIVLFLLFFLFFLISTRFPDKSGKIVPFDEVKELLSPEKFTEARNHFEKAIKFFDNEPKPDNENCIKDAICTLEACLETLSGKPASKDFDFVVKQLKGNGQGQIPHPIADIMLKHAYRGSGKAVAHAALQGNKVSDLEAELVLNQVATYIIYLFGLYSPSSIELK